MAMAGRNEVTIDLGHLAGFVTLAATLPSFHEEQVRSDQVDHEDNKKG